MEKIKQLIESGLSIIPIVKGEKRPAVKEWSTLQKTRLPYADFEGQYSTTDTGIICGKISGNLEVLDFDNHFGDAFKIFEEFYAMEGVSDVIELGLPIVKTRNKGYHIYYRCKEIEGSKKLARRVNGTGRPEVLIETRGEAAYVLAPPTDGYELISGNIEKIPTITTEHRKLLLNSCISMNEYTDNVKGQKVNNGSGQLRAGDEYNNSNESKSEAIAILKQHGWTSKDDVKWCRPNKNPKDGISATFGKVAANMFYVFSSNAYPFESGQGYYPLAVKALLSHNGDYTSTVKELTAKGYGSYQPPSSPISSNKKKQVPIIEARDFLMEYYDIRFNTITNRFSFKRKDENDSAYRDMNVVEMQVHAGELGKNIQLITLKSAINIPDVRMEINPMLEYFESVRFNKATDGTINRLASFFTLEDEELHPYFTEMLKKTLVRQIKCALVPHYYNRIIFTIIGSKQEIGKSFFVRWLNPFKDDEYYTESQITGDKDNRIAMTRNMMYNIEEVDSLGRIGIAKLKAIISSSVINERLPYAEETVSMHRICSFWATTNSDDFLEDYENTRWLCFDVKDIDWKYSKEIDKNDLWSEAYNLYLSGYNCELESEEKVQRNKLNLKVRYSSHAEELVSLVMVKSDSSWMQSTEIYNAIKMIYPNHDPTFNVTNLGIALKRLGYIKQRRSKGQGWFADLQSNIKPF